MLQVQGLHFENRLSGLRLRPLSVSTSLKSESSTRLTVSLHALIILSSHSIHGPSKVRQKRNLILNDVNTVCQDSRHWDHGKAR